MAAGRLTEGGVLLALLLCSSGALAENPPALSDGTEDEVPLLSPAQAVRLDRTPIVRMVDATTCEWIGVMVRRSGDALSLSGPGKTLALFRKSARRPFMHVQTRADSVAVARFPALPGEVFVSRSEGRDPVTGRLLGYGSPERGACQPAGKVTVGEPSTLREVVPDIER